MNNTPRTNAREKETENASDYRAMMRHAHYGWKFARSLEIENADLQSQLAERDAEIAAMQKAFGHYFVDPGTLWSSDYLDKIDPHRESCAQCGLNIRNVVHRRSKVTK